MENDYNFNEEWSKYWIDVNNMMVGGKYSEAKKLLETLTEKLVRSDEEISLEDFSEKIDLIRRLEKTIDRNLRLSQNKNDSSRDIKYQKPERKVRDYRTEAINVLRTMVSDEVTPEIAEIGLYDTRKKELDERLIDGDLLKAVEICNYLIAIPRDSETMEDRHYEAIELRGDIIKRMDDRAYDLEQRLKDLLGKERYEDATIVRDKIKQLRAEDK